MSKVRSTTHDGEDAGSAACILHVYGSIVEFAETRPSAA